MVTGSGSYPGIKIFELRSPRGGRCRGRSSSAPSIHSAYRAQAAIALGIRLAVPGHSGMGEIETVFANLVGRAFGQRGRLRVSEVRRGRFARTRLPVGNISARTAAEKRIGPAKRKRPGALVLEVGQLGLLVRSQDLVEGSIRFGFGGSGLSDFLS
jgi:hypothetical protein